MNAIEFSIGSESAMQALAATLAGLCQQGDVLLLHGDLGAGKTTFARGFIHALQAEPEEVLSPTFSLVQSYPSRDGFPLSHFDLYRLKSPEELVEIGFDEAIEESISLIEWPDIAASRLPVSVLNIHIAIWHDNLRQIKCEGKGAQWETRLNRLQEIWHEQNR